MIGTGTIINTFAVFAGGIGGLLFGKKMNERYQKTLMNAAGVCVLFLGISGAMEQMLQIQSGKLGTTGTMMVIASMAIGAVIGELINIEDAMEYFGEWLKAKTGSNEDNRFVDAFVSTSLTICIGAMAVVGSIKDGISGDYSILVAKAVLDLIVVLIMTASQGKGAIFSAIPLAFFQGSITILARFIQPLMTVQALANLSLVGSILIFCVGINLVWGKMIRVANMLPGLVIAVVCAFLPI